MVAAGVTTTNYEACRMTVTIDEPFDRFRERFERAVPRFDAARFEELDRQDAAWADVSRLTAENAPHSFMIYWSLEASALMRLAGGTRRCVEYLMGNHVIAERMYRHDPAALLYAPLRLAIYDGERGERGESDRHGLLTCLTIDQPSSHFASLGDLDITQVGLELDQKLADLLAHLRLTVPPPIAGVR
ncbi:hypothetical protein ACG83_34990 [Frankia sp. R43]|uniref:hypothetical protein n=1 Tax=Frankia sp. R43 TaxID=269536 RepID=UPI0006CA5A00|nr:hypothetical protein [Frankia sp. R43]KPM51342.1 hypothetical protein ACG83_34990 [Frankia sp. R43]